MGDPPQKKQKVNEVEEEELKLDGFETERILINDVKSKRVHVLGRKVFANKTAVSEYAFLLMQCVPVSANTHFFWRGDVWGNQLPKRQIMR